MIEEEKIRVRITETKRRYYFTTLEEGKKRTGWISKDLKEYSCCCIFSSFYKFGKMWTERGTWCKHAKHVREMIINAKY